METFKGIDLSVLSIAEIEDLTSKINVVKRKKNYVIREYVKDTVFQFINSKVNCFIVIYYNYMKQVIGKLLSCDYEDSNNIILKLDGYCIEPPYFNRTVTIRRIDTEHINFTNKNIKIETVSEEQYNQFVIDYKQYVSFLQSVKDFVKNTTTLNSLVNLSNLNL